MSKFFLYSKTFLVGLAMAVGPQALSYTTNFDWTTVGLSPNTASVIGVVMMALRVVTTTPIRTTPSA